MIPEQIKTPKSENCHLSEKSPFKLFGVEFYYLALFGIIISAVGFIAENLARLIGMGILDARFHILPFISPYGLVIFAFHLVLSDPDDLAMFGKKLFPDGMKHKKLYSNLSAYFLICLFVFLGELAVGNIWDIFFGVKLWDYSNLPLALTPYTSPIATFGYGSGAYLLFKFVYKPMLNFIKKNVTYRTAKLTSVILGTLIVLDTVRLMIMIIAFGEAPMYWTVNLW